MKIDVHYHLHLAPRDGAPDRVYEGMGAKLRGIGVEPEDQVDWLLANMDASGVEKTGVMNPYGRDHAFPNSGMADLFKKHGDRLFGWAGIFVNPKPDLEEARRAIEEYGFTGFKLIPTSQWFYPHDFELMGDFYALAEKEGWPLIWHMGPVLGPGFRAIFSDIRYLSEVAYQYPGLVLIMAHAGEHGAEEQAIALASTSKNVYIEASSRMTRTMCHLLPPHDGGDIFQRHKDEFLYAKEPLAAVVRDAFEVTRARHQELIRSIANRCQGKFMFGTDGPFATRLDLAVDEYERAFPDEVQRQKIFYDTAKSVLRL